MITIHLRKYSNVRKARNTCKIKRMHKREITNAVLIFAFQGNKNEYPLRWQLVTSFDCHNSREVRMNIPYDSSLH